VIDQMRTDYIYRYWNRFGEGGFKRLVNEGFFCKNTHYNYVPTYTGPGHSSIYTGAAPSAHGIIANDWFSKETGKEMYWKNTILISCSRKNFLIQRIYISWRHACSARRNRYC